MHGVDRSDAAPRAGYDCDVVVLGGGPAGSTAASWLARARRRVVVFERDAFPRFHIGESLLASTNDVLQAIGADATIRSARFPEKWGATLLSGDGRTERFADFTQARGVPMPQTWQVPRATFDHLLLQHAAASGADVRERHRVTDVAFHRDGATATVQRVDGGMPPFTIRTQAVIDASGRGSLLSRKFNLRVDEPRLANIAVFSHYSGVPRRDGRRAGDVRIVAREDLGWFWLIPISEELMSVGVVLPRAAAGKFRTMEPSELLEAVIAETPAVARLMESARREWPVRVEKDFSFGSRAYAGDRWALAGDAGSFLDPVFSTGVAIALESGLEAAQAVEAGLAAGDLSAARFRVYSRRQRRRYLSFRRFVLAFYTPEFRDVLFVSEPPRRIFASVVTILAGYWRPGLVTRGYVALFLLLVRLQRWFGFAPRLVNRSSSREELAASAR